MTVSTGAPATYAGKGVGRYSISLSAPLVRCRQMRGRFGVGLEANVQLLFKEHAAALTMPAKIYGVF